MSEPERYDIEPYELYYQLQGKTVKSAYAYWFSATFFFLGFGGFLTWVLNNWLSMPGVNTANIGFSFALVATLALGSLAIGTVLGVQFVMIVLLDLADAWNNDMILNKRAIVISQGVRHVPQIEEAPIVGSSPAKIPKRIRTLVPRFDTDQYDNILSYSINPTAYALMRAGERKKNHAKRRGRESPK